MQKQQWLFETPFTPADFAAAPILAGGYRNLWTASRDNQLWGKGGNYIITWNKNCTRPGRYSGETANLQDRLQHHVQHIRRFGLDPNKYQVLVTNKQDKPQTITSKQSRLKRQDGSIGYAIKRRIPMTNQIGGKPRESEYLFEVW
ncbi:hypothetical protein [Nostoc sp. TCL26-01]|uniref:hypothetical protein n=1 Tax=Nostoc sp. TCL26-01 TaxID=2576904 RepID=UPI0015BD82C2|nr:hypothetical protein [Nostoc sp. TCL26-01]QLE55456.1 hypothetical protein FD725_07960 [Nostoc sp. TCL26-01]